MLEPGELLAGLDVAGEQFFPEGYFCTGFYLIADEETGLVRYAGVGHPPAMIVGPNGPRTLHSNPGMLGIGMVDGTAGDADRLEPGESLVIYTDGLTDAMDPSDMLFGEERLKTVAPVALRSRPHRDPQPGRTAHRQAHGTGAPGGRYQHHRSPAASPSNAPQASFGMLNWSGWLRSLLRLGENVPFQAPRCRLGSARDPLELPFLDED